MGIEVPGSVRWLAEKVVGADWPDADETAMERLGQGWKTAGTSLDEIIDDADAAIRSALAGIEGDVNTAIAAEWQRIGAEGALQELSDFYSELGIMVDGSADDIRVAKLAIIAALVALAAELAAVAVATVMTLGAASPAAVAAEAATQVTVRMIMRQLIMALLKRVAIGAAKGVAVGGGLEAGKEFALQTYELQQGRRDSYDWGDVAEAGGKGAVAGSVKGAINEPFGIKGYTPAGQPAGLVGGFVQENTVGGTRFNEAVTDEVLDKTGLDETVGDTLDDLRETRDRYLP